MQANEAKIRAECEPKMEDLTLEKAKECFKEKLRLEAESMMKLKGMPKPTS